MTQWARALRVRPRHLDLTPTGTASHQVSSDDRQWGQSKHAKIQVAALDLSPAWGTKATESN